MLVQFKSDTRDFDELSFIFRNQSIISYVTWIFIHIIRDGIIGYFQDSFIDLINKVIYHEIFIVRTEIRKIIFIDFSKKIFR